MTCTSLLLPSRGRPTNIARLHQSIVDTAHGDWEMVVRLDDDDPTASEYPTLRNVTYLCGPRVVLSQYWNECFAAARGPVFMHAGDDIVMATPGWDVIVAEAFPADGIALVHGDDLGDRGTTFATHGFLRREWVDAVGYFVPPYFSSDFNDVWLNEVANALERRIFVPIVNEHLHPGFGKGPLDQTHLERMARHKADDCDAIYAQLIDERLRDVERLSAVMS